MEKPHLERWHQLVDSRNFGAIDSLLADNAVFYSPVVHTPQTGKARVGLYLGAAMNLLCSASFRYTRELCSSDQAALEFEANIDGVHINGIDLIHWDDAGNIDEFKVMIRPLKAINVIHDKMAALLAAAQDKNKRI
jgi:hypothetical protein